MATLQDIPITDGAMQTSNFAHVIFQNVAKSYLPHTQLECHYTLTPYIQPNPKDWVGIFKVGWSTARDYYTFLWSPLPENYTEESTVNCVLSFQGYYLPNDDGEFYQFCYVTHKGEIRGASTPFQFRTSSPVEELLTMEDEGQSDMLVVTTKTALLELRMEKTLKEKDDLLKLTTVLEKETTQLRQQVDRLEKELLHEKDSYHQLQTEQNDLFHTSKTLESENKVLKGKLEEVASKVLQLEDDIMSVTQKAIAKETELDSLKDKMKKVLSEKEQLDCQLKIEKDEKELYKVHLKNTEIENTKLITEIQTLKTVDANRENMITHYKEEVGRLQLCMAEKEKLQRDIILNSSNKEDAAFLKEQLRRADEQINASRQEAVLMSRELSDAVNTRDKTMSDLHCARLDNDKVKMQLAEAVAKLKTCEMEWQKNKVALSKSTPEVPSSTVELELRREVEDLKLRLQMAADHYKEKFKECQKLQRQVLKLTEQLTIADIQQVAGASGNTDPALLMVAELQEPLLSGSDSSDSCSECKINEQVREVSKEISEKTEKYKKCKQMLSEEKVKCTVYADELAKVEQKWKEQMKLTDALKLQLDATQSNMELEGRLSNRGERFPEVHSCRGPPQGLHFFIPYSEEGGGAAPVQNILPELKYGNPYVTPETRDGADGAFYPDEIQRSPTRSASWGLEDQVVCSQPARNLSRPDGLEDPEDGNDNDDNVPTAQDPRSMLLHEHGTRFCFDSSFDVHKKCPLCDVMFPPNYDQSKFEEHVESHWKMCPMCSEQFPPDINQEVFERHVQTHFDSSVLNFE